VIAPQNQPKHGYVIHEGTVRDAAENRVEVTVAQLRDAGIDATGEVLDPDPYSAVTDAMHDRDYDEIVISTHPDTRSGWLRQGLVQRIEQETGLPVEHVVVDLDADRDHVHRTLVVANQTIGAESLIRELKQMAAEDGPGRTFIVIVPKVEEDDDDSADRLAHTLARFEQEGLQAVGQLVHPDPYTAIMNALQFYPADEIVISTFPETKSGWLRGDLINRVKTATSKPVHHVIADDTSEVQG
jgi:nucleotide-binding universal stress UspA family protein